MPAEQAVVVEENVKINIPEEGAEMQEVNKLVDRIYDGLKVACGGGDFRISYELIGAALANTVSIGEDFGDRVDVEKVIKVFNGLVSKVVRTDKGSVDESAVKNRILTGMKSFAANAPEQLYLGDTVNKIEEYIKADITNVDVSPEPEISIKNSGKEGAETIEEEQSIEALRLKLNKLILEYNEKSRSSLPEREKTFREIADDLQDVKYRILEQIEAMERNIESLADKETP